MELTSNVHDTALIFEGGGMRGSYTAGVVNTLLENEIHFQDVFGVSAGASHTVNYLSRDIWRVHASFVELAADPDFGGWNTFLAGKGFFNAPYIYQETGKPDGVLPFNFQTFMENPAQMHILAFNQETGETVVWTKDDINDLADLMIRVRASSTLPVIMPSPEINGVLYSDGGLGEGAGLALKAAEDAGYERFFVVRTRPADYRKTDESNSIMNRILKKEPHMLAAVQTRSQRYNETCARLEQLASEGRAYIFYAHDQAVESDEKDVATLQLNYNAGYAQAQRELPLWRDFLGL